MKINKIEMNGYTLYHIPNKKFKTFTIGAYFFRPLDKKGLVENSILSNILMKYNQKYPSEQKFSHHLEDLYGMSLYVGFSRIGLVNNMNFIIRSINDKFLENCEENLFQEAVDLLNDAINLPYFNEEYFALEKSLLIEDIERVYDNKNQYATLKFVDIMYPNETCKFYVIGDIDLNTVKTAFDKISFNTYQKEELNFLDLETKQIEKVNEIIEKQANKQSIVLMGYRSEIRENDELYNGMFLLNHMLGGFFHSTLFQEVREKHSLAYSISSDYNSRKGTFVIHAGISADQFSKFKDIVNKIIEDYQNGIIDDDTMKLTKKMLINAQYKLADQPSYGASAIIKEVSDLKEKSPEEKAASIEKITNYESS